MAVPPADITSGTLLADVSRGKQGHKPGQSWKRIFVEAALFTLAAVLITSSWNVEHAGVFSIFLASAALAGRFNALLTENKENIWTHKKGSLASNRATALGLFAMFAGITAAYVCTAAFLGESRTGESFRFALSTAHLGSNTIATRRFNGLFALLSHNAAVLASFVVLALVYRSFGALLALTWNACVWGVVLTLLIARGIGLTEGSTIVFVLVALLALLPHLVLEALAYVLGALAGIFLSKGIAKYEVETPEFRKVAFASGYLVLCAAILLTLAACIEHWFPDQLLRLLRAH